MFKKVIGKCFDRIKKYKKIFFYFLLPNLGAGKRIKYKSLPVVQQRLVITGKGCVEIGENCSFGFTLGGFNYKGIIELQPRFANAKIEIKDNVSMNNNVCIISANRVVIGSETLIGQNVFLMDFEAHGVALDGRKKIGEIGEINIGRNVWIGNNVLVLKNSCIGDNSVIAAGAVVSGRFPANVIIGGVPAKIIKQL
ncbi:acyltransferase [Niabella sp. CC-SYL272]|uniref:acyltransferase n=1 Tax=Niabella agricola TaxID=2891571 RepID=UPI001F24E132|nr:acyltransferase [Niabella agricola]MCF3109939.1 acyltransferase [Niabella agricola]